VLSAPSEAATVRVEAYERTDVESDAALRVVGGRGEANRITVRDLGRRRVEVRDTAAPLRIGRSSKDQGRCRKRGRHVALCSIVHERFVTFVDAEDGSDAVILRGTKARTWIAGGGGDDRLVGGRMRDRIDGGSGADQVSGGAGSDVLIGGRGPDVLKGGAGNDLLAVADGPRLVEPDRLNGGPGRDTASWGGSRLSVRAALRGRRVHGETDRGANVEGLRGGEGNDRLTGGAGDDRLEAGSGDNVLIGRGGDDTLVFGDGELSEVNDARCGGGVDSVVEPRRWTYIRGDCERLIDESQSDAPLTPAMGLLPDGQLEITVFDESGEDFELDEFKIESPPARFPGVPRGAKVQSLGTVVGRSTGGNPGQATIRFDLSAAGRTYLGTGGKPVCVSLTFIGPGYCLRVPRRP
jgi:hypothetical protein